jgi:hypothetical protein
VAYTLWQHKPIKISVKEYYEVHHHGPRKMTWAGLCDEIFDYTGVQVRVEVFASMGVRVCSKR